MVFNHFLCCVFPQRSGRKVATKRRVSCFFEIVFWGIFAELVGIVLWNITTSFKKSAERPNLLPWTRIVVPLWPWYFHISGFQQIKTYWVKCGCFQIHHQAYQLTINLKHVSWTQKRIQRFGDLAILESPGRRFFFQKGSVSWGSHRCWFDGNSQQSRLFSRMVWDPNRTALGGCDLAIDTPKCIRKDTSHTWILRVWDFLCQFLGSTPLTQDLTPRHHQDDDWNWLDF